MARMRIGDMLVKAGLIDEMQLATALSQQRQWGGKLGDILVDQGFLDEMMLWLGLSKQLGVPLVSLAEGAPAPDVLALVPLDLCDRLEIFPVSRDERTVTIATSDPNNIGALDEVAFRVGLKVKTVLAPLREVSWAIRHHYKGDPQPCPPPRVRRQLPSEPPAPVNEPQLPQAPPVSSASLLPTGTATPIQQIARTAPPAPTTGAPIAPPDGWQPPAPSVEDQLRQANEVLYALVEMCVERGVFTRDELWARLTQLTQLKR